MSGATLATKDAVDPLIHKGYLEELASAYVPAGIARNDPRISPLFADLHGLPPMLIQVGSAETLLDDSVRFAGAAGAADVAVTLEVWPRHDPCLADVERASSRPGVRRSPTPAHSCGGTLAGRGTSLFFDGRSQTLHLKGGDGSPGSTITEVNSPQPPHCRTSLVGSFTIGLVADGHGLLALGPQLGLGHRCCPLPVFHVESLCALPHADPCRMGDHHVNTRA